jgi:chemotaxis signal transduction protein
MPPLDEPLLSVLSLASLDVLHPAAPTTTTEHRFLNFSLGHEDTALLPVESIAEVLRVPMTEVLPVPQMPGSILGIYNRRGEMLWLVDLGHLVGHPLTFQPGNPFVTGMAMVLEIEGQFLGLVVKQVHDIESIDPQTIQPPSTQLFSPKLLPFVQGYLSDSVQVVLDPHAIARSLT